MTRVLIGDDHPVRRAAQRFVLVIGAGALGAAVCSTGVRYAGPDEDEALRAALRDANPPAPSSRQIGAAEAEALTLLRQAAAAESATSYQGRKLYGSWSASGGESVLADVRHIAGRSTLLTVTSAGTPGGRGDAEEIADAGGDLDPEALARLTDRYALRIAEEDRCIGRPTTVVEATELAGGRVAGRFWIDNDSGLLLRRELYDESGRTVRATEVLDLSVEKRSEHLAGPRSTATVQLESERAPAKAKQSDRLLGPGALADLRKDGWVLPAALPAGLVLYRARWVDTHGGRAVHLTYSDGLFAVSLFAQRGRLDSSELRGFTPAKVGGAIVHSRPGLYRQLVWGGGNHVYTLVSDAPDAELEQVVGALPHSEPTTGMLSRVGRGIDRMGSWINPFE